VFARLLWRSLRARRARLALALLSVSLGVAVATTLATLSLGVGDDLARTLRAAGPNFVVMPKGARWPVDLGGAAFTPARAGASLGDSVVTALRSTFWSNNLLAASPELDVHARLDGHPVTISGAWFAHAEHEAAGDWETGLPLLHPRWQIAGRWPRDDANEIAIGVACARAVGMHAGESAPLDVGGETANVTVTGIVSAGGTDDERAWMPLALAQRLAHRPDEADRVWLSALVKPETRRAPPDAARDPVAYERWMCTAYPTVVADAFRNRLSGADVLPMSEVVAGEAHVVGRLNLLMLLLGLAALTASTLGLLSTTAATVVERRVEIGLLRALGASSRQLAALLFGETLLVSLFGGAFGWAAGSLAALLIRGQSFGTSGSIQPLLLPVALVLAIAVATLGTLGPLRAALNVEPTLVLRGTA
jgi:putative ABC transport system permease protein